MLSSASEAILCDLLVKVIQCEKAVEIQRNILAQDYLFNPLVAFDCLDSLELRSLIPKSFKDFLNNARPDITEQQLYLVIRQYSSTNNGHLYFEDFMRLVLPSTNPTLYELAASRRSLEFTYSQEFALIRLLEKEVELQVTCEQLKQALCGSEDFSVWKAFKTIDQFGFGLLTETQLVDFGRRHGHYWYSDDVDALLRRISIIDTHDVSYQEFLEFLLPVYSEFKQEASEEQKEETQQESEKEQNKESDKESDKDDVQERLFETPVKKQEAKDREPAARALFKDDPAELKELLLEQVRANMTLESLRQLLAVQQNFSAEEVLQFFTQDDWVRLQQFSEGLHQLRVKHTAEDVEQVFSRYGFTEDGVPLLDLNSLRNLLFPTTPEYLRKLEGRAPQELSARTLTYLGELLATLIESEQNLLQLKKTFAKDTDFAALFEALDQDSDGVVSGEEMKAALTRAGIDATDKELEGLFLRYVRSPQDKLDFEAFQQELQA